jgi:hypothetical protein
MDFWKTYNVIEHGKEYDIQIHRDGSIVWRLNGNFHRDYGPATKAANGSEFWYKDNFCHRDDGYAMDRRHGESVWALSGVRKSFYDLIFYENK